MCHFCNSMAGVCRKRLTLGWRVCRSRNSAQYLHSEGGRHPPLGGSEYGDGTLPDSIFSLIYLSDRTDSCHNGYGRPLFGYSWVVVWVWQFSTFAEKGSHGENFLWTFSHLVCYIVTMNLWQLIKLILKKDNKVKRWLR